MALIVIYAKMSTTDEYYIETAQTDEAFGFTGIYPWDISWWIVPGTLNEDEK